MAIDHCQPQVERALIKDGWTITASPKHIRFKESDYYVDLELVRFVENEQGQLHKINVEVKCLDTRSNIYTAIGQFSAYKYVMIATNSEATLYLAVPENAYREVFDEILEKSFIDNGVRIILIDLENEVVKAWITF